jgi:SPP1 gp7 family putative phage head morphogenesis protein
VEELTKFQAYLSTEIVNAAELSFAAGSAQSQELIKALLAEAGIQAQLGGLPANSFQAIVSFLAPGSPLYDRIELLAGTLADYVRETLLEAVALGYNPIKTARLIQEAFGRGLTDALRMARTAQLYAHRVATQANYQNSDVLDGWVWYAQLDETVCQSCIVMHGTIHPLSEVLNDHHNGRCAMLPYMEEFGNPIDQLGTDWFKNLSEAQQKNILGPGKFEAWKAGQFSLDQLSRETENDVYGLMRTETPLKDLIK